MTDVQTVVASDDAQAREHRTATMWLPMIAERLIEQGAHVDAANVMAASSMMLSMEERLERAEDLLRDLFTGFNFQVSIGGNPILVEQILDRIEDWRFLSRRDIRQAMEGERARQIGEQPC